MSVRLLAWSDYLCPWCYNGSVRVALLRERYGDELDIEYRSFLLRPAPGPRDLEQFRAYTRSWQRPGADPDAGTFQTWQGDAGPPSHSIPPHLVAKAAARLGPDAFRAVHERLLHAYFAESRDITADSELTALWKDAGLPPGAFAAREDPVLLAEVLDQHRDALDRGISGVPTLALEGREGFLTGAYPLDQLDRWVRRALSGEI